MYNLDSVLRRIKKEGVDKLISDISSENFSEDAKEELSRCGIISNGYPNLSLIYSLA